MWWGHTGWRSAWSGSTPWGSLLSGWESQPSERPLRRRGLYIAEEVLLLHGVRLKATGIQEDDRVGLGWGFLERNDARYEAVSVLWHVL